MPRIAKKSPSKAASASTKAAEIPEIHGPMQPETAEIKQPEKVAEQPKKLEISEDPVYLGVYAKKHATHDGADFDPTWGNKDKIFVVGRYRPKSPTSRMGVLYAYVEAAGEAGISGAELATKLRNHNWGDSRSKYTIASKPPIGWAEGYVNGALSVKQGHIKIRG